MAEATQDEINTLIRELQRDTGVSRVTMSEMQRVFQRIAELGYSVNAPAEPIPNPNG